MKAVRITLRWPTLVGISAPLHPTIAHSRLYPLAWTIGQATRCTSPVPHTQTYADGTFPCITIDPDYKAKWAQQ
jgi:hypothetical protein